MRALWKDHLKTLTLELRRCLIGDDGDGSTTDPGSTGSGTAAEAAYPWAMRLSALRCLEARGLAAPVLRQLWARSGCASRADARAGRRRTTASEAPRELADRVREQFALQARDYPWFFNTSDLGCGTASARALHRCIGLLVGEVAPHGGRPVTDAVFREPTALGWIHQFWHTEEKNRVFERLAHEQGFKVEGAELAAATCIYTHEHLVKWLVHNSLGALWAGMHPQSELPNTWEYFVKQAARPHIAPKDVRDIRFFDPACGTGHFLVEAFDLLASMYRAEGRITDPLAIVTSILERNLYGADIDFRDPVRHTPPGRVIVAPADGRVLYVRPVRAGSAPCPIKGGTPVTLEEWVGPVASELDGTLVGIYMTPLSVHYNRAPVAGRITRIVRRDARGENLSMSRAFVRLMWNMLPYEEDCRYILQNARNTIVIEGELVAAIVQIADRQVDQVDCYVTEGQWVEAGAKVGMIRMGSQCDLFIPDAAGVRLRCKAGDRVLAGETVLGVY